MNPNAKLTKRETEVCELIAWGATKKDVANRCFISIRTVENTVRNIFNKIGVTKVNELSAWWFCVQFNISFDLSPLKKTAIATLLLILTFSNEALQARPAVRQYRSQRTEYRAGRVRTRRTRETDICEYVIDL